MNQVKVVVWDLDNTVWDGTLLENDDLTVRSSILELIDRLDRAGVVQSAASRSDETAARAAMSANGLDRYFVFPQISWEDKSNSISTLAAELNLRLENFAFVDDDEFERAQVTTVLPQVRVFDSNSPTLETDVMADVVESAVQLGTSRRELYRTEEIRQQAESTSGLSKEQFLAGLQMKMTLRRAEDRDADRIIELMSRTNQLNTTGVIWSVNDLQEIIDDSKYAVIVASMEDRFGTHGVVGLSILKTAGSALRMELLLTSCRVANRGAGSLLLRAIIRTAAADGTAVQCDFIPNQRNRQMAIALRFSGLVDTGPCDEHAGCRLFALDEGAALPTYPPHIRVGSEISGPLVYRAPEGPAHE